MTRGALFAAMPHEVVIASERVALRNVLDVGRAGARLRLHRLASGDAVAVSAAAATRDGRPLLGNVGVVEWGTGAIVRVGPLRVEIAWRAAGERSGGVAGRRCRLCLASFVAGEPVVACPCSAEFHDECDALRASCVACGAPRQEGCE